MSRKLSVVEARLRLGDELFRLQQTGFTDFSRYSGAVDSLIEAARAEAALPPLSGQAHRGG